MESAAKTTLANLVEDQLSHLLQESSCVQRHTKHARVSYTATATTTRDKATNNNRRRIRNNNNSTTSQITQLLDADDINLALLWRGSEQIYTTNAGAPFASTSRTTTASATTNETTNGTSAVLPPRPEWLTASDRSFQRIDLNAYVRSEMQSRPPSEIALHVHWLAVDGVQPNIPQNPPPLLGAKSVVPMNDTMAHRIEDDDSSSSQTQTSDDPLSSTTGNNVSIRQLLPRLLSEELQFYFTRITLAVRTETNPQQQDAALASVARDSGTQELVPFFAGFVSTQIFGNVGRAEYCRTLIKLADALISNPHMHLELHLHQMLPAIITCVVAQKLSSNPHDDHWALREEAARTLVRACNIFGDQYTTLKSRILKTLCEAITPNKPRTTQYGGIVGISFFGPKAIDAFLLQLAPSYWLKWDEELCRCDERNRDDWFELRQCQSALLNAIGTFLHHSNLYEKCNDMDIEAFQEVFGEKLIPLQTGLSGYESFVL